MQMTMIDDYARRLYTAHGDRAEFEAAQRARECEDQGRLETAEQWRRIRGRIRLIRGPNAS